MAQFTMPPRSGRTLRGAAFLAAALTVTPALGEEPAKEPAKDPIVTVTLPAVGKARAALTVNADDPAGPPLVFTVKVGNNSQTFSKATPPASRKIEVPADAKAYLRFTVEKAGGSPENVLALIAPDSRPLLTPDTCGTWDFATSGASGASMCVDRQRFCPTASRATTDRRLTETQCGSSAAKFCIPDYRLDVVGEAKQKVRVGVDGSLGAWIFFKTSGRVHHLNLPSIGKCRGVTLESGSDRVRLVIASGQRALVKVDSTGQISAEEAPAPARQSGGGGGD